MLCSTPTQPAAAAASSSSSVPPQSLSVFPARDAMYYRFSPSQQAMIDRVNLLFDGAKLLMYMYENEAGKDVSTT